jgi:hypothetical protein
MISDLSTGDKLSLKGKIFELQKKLQIIDFEKQRKEEFSFKPSKFTSNENFLDNDRNASDSYNKADLIRKV